MRRFIITLSVATVLSAVGVSVASAQLPPVEQIIERWDANGDGAVTREEFLAAGRPADHFDLVDTNKDGKITVEELKAFLAARQQQNGG